MTAFESQQYPNVASEIGGWWYCFIIKLLFASSSSFVNFFINTHHCLPVIYDHVPHHYALFAQA